MTPVSTRALAPLSLVKHGFQAEPPPGRPPWWLQEDRRLGNCPLLGTAMGAAVLGPVGFGLCKAATMWPPRVFTPESTPGMGIRAPQVYAKAALPCHQPERGLKTQSERKVKLSCCHLGPSLLPGVFRPYPDLCSRCAAFPAVKEELYSWSGQGSPGWEAPSPAWPPLHHPSSPAQCQSRTQPWALRPLRGGTPQHRARAP